MYVKSCNNIHGVILFFYGHIKDSDGKQTAIELKLERLISNYTFRTHMNSKEEHSNFFYKYLKIDGHTPENLEKNQLYFKYPLEYNDPFDSMTDFCTATTKEKWIDYWRKHNVTMSKKEAKDDFNEFIKKGIIKKKGHFNIYEMSIEYFNNSSPRFMTCCFTTKRDDILMWSHYADHHKGICLIFKSEYKSDPSGSKYAIKYESQCALTVNSEQELLYKIDYKPELPYQVNLVDEFLAKAEDKRAFEFLVTKSEVWTYENEYRIVIIPSEENKNLKIKSFKKEELAGIIFGLRVEYDGADKIYKIIDENYKGIPIKYFKAQAKIDNGKKAYALDIIEIPANEIKEYIKSLNKGLTVNQI